MLAARSTRPSRVARVRRVTGATLRLALPLAAAGWCGAALAAPAGPAGAIAQSAAAAPTAPATPAVAVPFYTAEHFVQGLHRDHTAPAAAAFAERTAALTPALQQLCATGEAGAAPALQAARARWAAAVAAWERLAAVAVGPLIERRSLRTLDFSPTRPALIERAIKAQPSGAAALAEIGAPAKGLPALEWLLWTRPVAPGSPACRYAAEVAADLGREAAALQRDVDAAAARDWAGEAASTAMAEAVNQWLGGLERLRWQDIGRPLEAAGDAGRNAPKVPRSASGLSAASWAAQWQALRALAVQPRDAPPQPAGEGLVTLETYLRGRGLAAPADALRQAVAGADAAMQGLAPPASPEPGATPATPAAPSPQAASPQHLREAVQALTTLKQVLENQVAPALDVSIGFSDADGD